MSIEQRLRDLEQSLANLPARIAAAPAGRQSMILGYVTEDLVPGDTANFRRLHPDGSEYDSAFDEDVRMPDFDEAETVEQDTKLWATYYEGELVYVVNWCPVEEE